MNEIEKTAMTDEKTMPSTDEKKLLSESRSTSLRSTAVSSSESENELSGRANSSCKLCCARATGSPMLLMTMPKSTSANWFILLKTSGTKSEHSTAATVQMTRSVTSAANARGTFHCRTCSAASRLTNGRPMTASTADTRI